MELAVKLVTKLVDTEEASTVMPSIVPIGSAAWAYESVQISLKDKVAEATTALANTTAGAKRVERMLLLDQAIEDLRRVNGAWSWDKEQGVRLSASL